MGAAASAAPSCDNDNLATSYDVAAEDALMGAECVGTAICSSAYSSELKEIRRQVPRRKHLPAGLGRRQSRLRVIHFGRCSGSPCSVILRTQPERIALLRLDTDWYESTRHELAHLYPLLARQGVMIIDDYGHWQGARKAVDEYFAGQPVYLHRVDYTARLLVKPA